MTQHASRITHHSVVCIIGLGYVGLPLARRRLGILHLALGSLVHPFLSYVELNINTTGN